MDVWSGLDLSPFLQGICLNSSATAGSDNSLTEVSHVVQVRAEGPKAPSPGHRPQAARPEGAEALSPGHRPGYNANQKGAL